MLGNSDLSKIRVLGLPGRLGRAARSASWPQKPARLSDAVGRRGQSARSGGVVGLQGQAAREASAASRLGASLPCIENLDVSRRFASPSILAMATTKTSTIL